jgi:hypothetical protein
MCQFSTSDESIENHHYLAGTRVTIKLALRAGPLGQIFELTIMKVNASVPEYVLIPGNVSLNRSVTFYGVCVFVCKWNKLN